jgi:hypothetical protein
LWLLSERPSTPEFPTSSVRRTANMFQKQHFRNHILDPFLSFCQVSVSEDHSC